MTAEYGYGRPELRPYLIARRSFGTTAGTWRQVGSLSIDEAREMFDRGEAEMVQGVQRREGSPSWWLLYCIPRKVKARPYDYFGTLGHAQPHNPRRSHVRAEVSA